MINSKIIFCCNSVDRGGFAKIVFEAILPGDSVNSIEDANGWMYNNISKHYFDFDLDFVLDWFVLLFEPTNDNPKETEIIKNVKGKLIFEDDIDYFYYNIGKIKSETKKIKQETKKLKKEIKKSKEKDENKQRRDPSIWVDPIGTEYEVGFANHEQFAQDWLQENDIETWKNQKSRYGYEILQERGWVRVLGWTTPPTFVVPSKITPKQKTILMEYCVKNNITGNDFPEILKNK